MHLSACTHDTYLQIMVLLRRIYDAGSTDMGYYLQGDSYDPYGGKGELLHACE